ncbi:heterokaryon incompatibility protein-domain-containing protein [Pestalotiopsis sp. NC0098]|nr:heterokaryon incompatibility protein-domain-containing protein [Pestalotiopsis sp. NC0098]
MDTYNDLCVGCAECLRWFESHLDDKGQWGAKLREWEHPEDLKEDCTFCSFLSQMKHEKNYQCDAAASHTKASLWARTIPDDQFLRPPVKTATHLEFWWSCGTSLWYFFEDDEKNHLQGTVGFAYDVNPTLDESDWDVIRQWVDGCLKLHRSGCVCQDEFDLPGFKVIDCKTRKLVSRVNGVEFAALSYVWGSPQAQPHKTNGASRPHTFPDSLPKDIPETVIEDALTCASKLNIPYLWVDRYCIDQKPTTDTERDTKQHLIQSMDKIYSTAKITIISVAGNDASAGLPGIPASRSVSSPSSAVIGSHRMVPVINPKHGIKRSRWARRGWTLQEGLLARRRLVFTDTRVYFQCTQSHYIEGLCGEFHSHEQDQDLGSAQRVTTRAFPGSVIGSPSSSLSIAKVCNYFTSSDLTSDEDALNACLGLFSRFWKMDKPMYQYCGLPFQDKSDASFALSLLWEASLDQFQGGPENDPLPFRRAWGPSWSWLAWRGDMGFRRCSKWKESDQPSLCADIKIPKCRREQTTMSTIGDYIKDIDEGGLYQYWLPYLRLSGWIATLRFEHGYNPQDSFNGYAKCYVPTEQGIVGYGDILRSGWAKVKTDDETSNSSRHLDVILIADNCFHCKHCLVIHRVIDEKPNAYERLGTCELVYDSPEIKLVQNRAYLTVRETRSLDRKIWDLECRYDTITLV